MSVTLEKLKAHGQDYLFAYMEDGQLVMEPFCNCGQALAEDLQCPVCRRDCDCNFVACSEIAVLSLVEKLIAGNPNFRNFNTALLEK